MEDTIRAYAVQNASRFNGKANPGAVLGKILSEKPELRKDIASIKSKVAEIVAEINSLSIEEQQDLLRRHPPKEVKKKEADMFEFIDIKGRVTTAFPPEPSKYPHIGHAKALVINYELAKRNNGSFILRFDDTNPKLVKKKFYDIHLEDYAWLGIKWDKLDYGSSHMEEFYRYAEVLISQDDAYVCSCPQELIRDNRFRGRACRCRSNNTEENLALWKQMFSSAEGSLILRLKIDLKHKNTTMRDPSIMRIIDFPHPLCKKRYRVWPTYDFETTLMDSLGRITHRIRTKEFEMRNELQRYIQEKLGFSPTSIYEFARFNLEGVESSGRIIREKIEKHELIGWDDPSLTTLRALRRRGFLPEAIKEFVLSTGITKAESTLTWDTLITYNRRILEPDAERYFFVHDPVKIIIRGAPEKRLKLRLHPDNDLGYRDFRTSDRFYIAKKDLDRLKQGKIHRLMDCLNFRVEGNSFVYDSDDIGSFRSNQGNIIHWLPADSIIRAEVLMPDKALVKGYAESGISNLRENDVIQFARFGFCRLDSKRSNRFWYTHG